jgi:hypothetical protein
LGFGFVWLAVLAIAFAMGMHIYRMSGMPFTNLDDMLMELTADRMRTQGWWRSYYALAWLYATWQGRIYFYFSMFFFVLPFLIRSVVWRAVASALLQLASICSVGAVVSQYAGFGNALLSVALACAWLPYWRTVSPVNGFPFVYHLPVLLFFAGLAVWIRLARGGCQRRPRLARVFCWSALFVSLFFYEALIPPFGLIALTVSAAETRRIGKSWRAVARAWIPWLACFALWAAIYLGFRWIHPGTYGGSALSGVGHGQLHSAAVSLFYFETYSLPGANWIGNLHFIADRLSGSPLSGSSKLPGYLPFFLRNLTADGIVLAVLVAAMLLFRAREWRPSAGMLRTARAAALALLCAVLCPLPLAFTSKYRSLDIVLTVAPYLPGYYAFLAWCVFLALAFSLVGFALRRVPAIRWTAAFLLAAVFAVTSAANAMSNNALYGFYAELNDKNAMVDLLARSDWFASVPPHAVFLAPGFWDNFPSTAWLHGDAYWSAYFSAWAGRPLEVLRVPREVPELLVRHTPVFYCEHQWLPGRMNSILVIEPVVSIASSGEALSDSVLLFSRIPPQGFTVQYRSPASDAAGAGPLRARIPAWSYAHGAYLARLSLPGLIAGTAQVNLEDAPHPAPLLDFGDGFSHIEHDPDGAHYWLWSDGADGQAELRLLNPSPQSIDVRFRTELQFDPRQTRAAFELILPGTSPGTSETFTAANGETIERTWRLAPGTNRILLKCHAGRMPAPGDKRHIVFGLRDWSMTPVR